MTEREHRQGNRRTGSLGDRLVGLVLLLACCGLIWWQESSPAREDAPNLPPVHEAADPSPGSLPVGELVHMSGPLRTQALLTDSLTGTTVCAPGIRREVEYFQWVEVTRPATGDGTGQAAHAYHQRWVSRPVDSAAFQSETARRRYANMVLADIPDESRHADDVTLCGYRLPPALVATLPAEEPLEVTVSEALRDRLNREAAQAHRSAARGPLMVSNVVHAQGGIIYIGAGGTPRNGDVRIVFSRVDPAQVSLLAAVSGTDVVPCRLPGGREICRLMPGAHSAADMLEALALPGGSGRSVWPLRLAAALGGLGGLYLLLRPARREAADA